MNNSKHKTLKDLQREFSQKFPYLRIEFYSRPHKYGELSNESEILDPNTNLYEVVEMSQPGKLPLAGNQTVGDFEQLLSKNYGLNVQVLRKSYGKWLLTWATDMWTLDEQNNRSRIMGNKILK